MRRALKPWEAALAVVIKPPQQSRTEEIQRKNNRAFAAGKRLRERLEMQSVSKPKPEHGRNRRKRAEQRRRARGSD